MEGPTLPAVTLPPDSAFTSEWVRDLAAKLGDATWAGPAHLKTVLPPDVCTQLLDACQLLLHAEPTLLKVTPPADGRVVVVGDTHGQFHDVCNMMALEGHPSASNTIVFNGDFVDRGAWGLETLLLLVSWKLALPGSVFLLRGNHESATCTMCYGFKGEVVAKYGKSHWRPVYAACKRLFSSLPLSARIGEFTLVLHGGLFRRPLQRSTGKNKRKRAHPLMFGLDDVTLGSLEDLQRSTKGGMDPNGVGASRLASDVLWSDPVADPGFRTNVQRGVGMCFGPDVTERFLSENGLRLVLRSHEGPDAREGREDMKGMLGGFTLDHDTPAGKLMTVFSAPDYPQFIPEEAERYNNLAAVAILEGPDWATPTMRQYAAAHPRPEAKPYYDLYVPDSDEEFEPAPMDASGMTGVERDGEGGAAPTLSVASDAGTSQQQQEEEEVEQRQQQHEQPEEQQEQPGQQQEQQPSLPAGVEAVDSFAVQAAAEAAAAETSSKSEETAVAEPEAGVEGSSGLVAVKLSEPAAADAAGAAGSRGGDETGTSPRKRSKRAGGGAAAADAPPSVATAVEVA